MVAKTVLTALQAVITVLGQVSHMTENSVLQEKTVELRDQVVDKGGIALVRRLRKQHCALSACLCSCIASAALNVVLQHPNQVELVTQVL